MVIIDSDWVIFETGHIILSISLYLCLSGQTLFTDPCRYSDRAWLQRGIRNVAPPVLYRYLALPYMLMEPIGYWDSDLVSRQSVLPHRVIRERDSISQKSTKSNKIRFIGATNIIIGHKLLESRK